MDIFLVKNQFLYADNIYIIDIIVIHHVAAKAVVIKGVFGYKNLLYVDCPPKLGDPTD